ncbi:hypothetical protein N7472_009249 [Penicillium cf. griseofulvum]|uniref:LysM domain-containing protein n=1 Tax=Penicillium cf. griseofulvum TaxID=2972120 RepID=A0A9W9IST7_9EURO|nr:hypothetical protein N7472_009249 [Penicillium cf. griseofulvum]
MIIFRCLAWAALALFANGQQFDGYEMPYDDLGLSSACFDAVNTTVSSCPAWVAGYTGVDSPTGTLIVSEGTSATTTVAVPTNAQSLSNTNCTEWHEVLSREDCSTISLKFAISLSDFYFLNPQVDSNYTNLWLNTSYCVEAVGNIATYTGYVTSTAAYTFTKPASATYTPTPAFTATLEPTASGTIEGCAVYNNAFSSTIANATTLNSCEIWASIADVTVDNLLSWNPSLSASDSSQHLPYNYCFAANSSLIPSTSVQPSDCNCYIQLRAADKSAFNCTMFSSLSNVSVTTVTSLNPWIGSDCDTGVWSALSGDGFEQICVERSSPAVPTSATSTISPASTSTISTIATPPAEVMPNEASNCNKWHTVVSGDGCQAIADQNNILLSNFYTWNPSVGTTCASLWIGYAVCVGVSS